MAIELVLLGALIFIFIVSFCGLLQRIKLTYDRERILAERIIERRREQQRTQRRSMDSFDEVYANQNFRTDAIDGVFPTSSPPPYSQNYVEPPPKYDEVVKVHQQPNSSPNQTDNTTEVRSSTDTGPPPYTINVTFVTTEAVTNRY